MPSSTYQQECAAILLPDHDRGMAGKHLCYVYMQDVIKTACSPDQAGTGLQPRLRDAIVLMLSAAPQGSELVRDVLLAIQHGLEVACSTSFLPELLLRLLQLPDVSQVGWLHKQRCIIHQHGRLDKSRRVHEHHGVYINVAGDYSFAYTITPS